MSCWKSKLMEWKCKHTQKFFIWLKQCCKPFLEASWFLLVKWYHRKETCTCRYTSKFLGKNIKQFKVTQEVTTKKFIFCSKKPFFISSTTKIFHSYHSVLKIIHKICRGKMETQLCPHSYTLSGISLVSSIFSHLLSAAYNFTSSPLQP